MILYENERSSQSEYLYHQNNINLNFQKHAHYSFEVVFVLDGKLICQVDNEEFILKKDQILLILPGQVHSYATNNYSKSYLCVFSNDLVENFYKEVKAKCFVNPVFEMENYYTLIEILTGDNNLFFKQATLYNLCAVALDNSKLINIEQPNFMLSSMLAFYVQNNFTKDISLKTLAKEQGYNYTYLSSFFNNTFKQNFASYVNQFRLQYASHLLETTGKDITEIASESGFSTIRNFNTAFKKKYSLTPSEYRRAK